MIYKEGFTRKQAVAYFAVTQPRVNDLSRGKPGRFIIDMLITLLVRTDRYVRISVTSRAA